MNFKFSSSSTTASQVSRSKEEAALSCFDKLPVPDTKKGECGNPMETAVGLQMVLGRLHIPRYLIDSTWVWCISNTDLHQ